MTSDPKHPERPTAPHPDDIDVSERGAAVDGVPRKLDRRLFMQLQVFSGCASIDPLLSALKGLGQQCVLYKDVNDPKGVGLLTMSEDPGWFVRDLRDLLNAPPFAALTHRPQLTMMGRSYASGYEQDLEEWLLSKPRRTVLNPQWPWAIWYPLRRTGSFARLRPDEQGGILREHGAIGRAYGEAGLAHDVRLACHGLDANDNEFVIGLVGSDLHPLSHVVQTMRRTRQTSDYIQSMGPFFIGYAARQA